MQYAQHKTHILPGYVKNREENVVFGRARFTWSNHLHELDFLIKLQRSR